MCTGRLTKNLFLTGCLYNSDLCDEFEFCHNDNYKGICLQDGPVDEDDTQANENGLSNLNRENENEESLDDRFDKYKFDEFIDKLRRARYQEPKDYLKSDNDEKADCIRDLDAKYGDYKNDADYDAYWNLLKIVCEEYVANGNRPRIPLVDGDNDGKPDLKYYLNLREEIRPKEEPFVVEPEEAREERNLELTDDDLKSQSLNDKLKEINENLDEAELYARDTNTKNKKLDQKKPGPILFNNRYVVDDDLDENEENRFNEDDNKFNDKRFDETRILKPSGANSLQFDSDEDERSADMFKRKAGFTNPSPPTDHKPVEEGAVRVELDPQKKVQLIEPTEPGEKSSSPFVAVDSSYAYIYFLKDQKHPKASDQSDQSADQLPEDQQQEAYRQILNDEQLMEVDDIQARRYFIDNLRKRMSLPKGSFSDIKLESADPKALPDCVPFAFLKYFFIFDNNEQNCNCKLLIATFKVNPNIQQLNASLVADRIGMWTFFKKVSSFPSLVLFLD